MSSSRRHSSFSNRRDSTSYQPRRESTSEQQHRSSYSAPRGSTSSTSRALPNWYSNPLAAFNASGPSYRGSRARPREGYVQRIMSQLRRLIRDALAYIRKNPAKVIVPIVMALISGGALAGLLKKVGIRLPSGMERAIGVAGSEGMKYDGFYGSQNSREAQGFDSGGLIKSAVKVASAFL